MTIDLDDLDETTIAEPDADIFGDDPIDLDGLVAAPGHAPLPGQSRAPDSMYTGVKPPVKDSSELRRVMALKRRPQLDPDSERALKLAQLMTARYRRERSTPCACATHAPRRFQNNPNACIRELNVSQAWCLWEAGIQQGWLGAIGVGHGKTVVDILGGLALCDAWAHAQRRKGVDIDSIVDRDGRRGREVFKILLLVPPGLQEQLATEYRLLGEHFRVPSIVFQKKPIHYAVPGEPWLHVFPYSALSRPDATTYMRSLKPDAIIGDEAHMIGNVESTRGGRVWYYHEEFPGTRCGFHTGSLTDSSITDYMALAEMALKAGSPVPRPSFRDDDANESGFMVGREWASALDPSDDWLANPGALLDALVESGCCVAGDESRRNVYGGFRVRLVETPGFIATRDSAVKCGLEISERRPHVDAPAGRGDNVPNRPREDPSAPNGEGWPGVADCLDMIRSGVRPDGEELLEDGQFAIARCAREMASGFFNRWVFPRGEPDELIADWRMKRKFFFCAIREKLKRREEHMDSPFLLKLAAMRYYGDIPRGGFVEVIDDISGDVKLVDTSNLPEWDAEGTWCDWRDVAKLVEPTTEPVWVDEFLARDAAEWARDHRGIVWYDHVAFGNMVAKLGKLRKHGGGPEAPVKLVGGEYKGKTYPGEDGKESIVVSIKSHGTGRNGLQYLFDEQLVANPLSSNEGWEQLLGRLHRIGQNSETVRTWFYQHTAEVKRHVGQALRRAFYVSSTLGSNQKLRVGFKLFGDEE